MRHTALLATLVVAAALAPRPHAQPAAVDGLVARASVGTAAQTEERLREAIEAAGLKVAFRLDHAANAASVGQELPPTVVFLFGNPSAGTPLLAARRTVGIDLPMRMLIWEEAGAVQVAYNDPGWTGARHGLEGQDEALAKMAGALEKLAQAAAGP